MKKLILLMFVLLISFSFSFCCYAEEAGQVKSQRGSYVSYNLGITMVSDSDVTDSTVPGVTVNFESDPGFAFGLALGYALENGFRFEGEALYQRNELDKASYGSTSTNIGGHSTIVSFLANGYYDFTNSSRLTPFVTAGIGFARVGVNLDFPGSGLPAVSDHDVVFAYQAGLGAAYAVTETFLIDCKYRYLATTDPEFETTEAEIASHNIYFGARLAF